mmetsp:Transcript_24478/g.48675  ORF Transcript_24478/g.48675 Transcript_24478/m.48675 type:complete len:216 (+) Transcript_24478:287-934(+)
MQCFACSHCIQRGSQRNRRLRRNPRRNRRRQNLHQRHLVLRIPPLHGTPTRRPRRRRQKRTLRLLLHQPRLPPPSARHQKRRPGGISDQLLHREHDAHGLRARVRRVHVEGRFGGDERGGARGGLRAQFWDVFDGFHLRGGCCCRGGGLREIKYREVNVAYGFWHDDLSNGFRCRLGRSDHGKPLVFAMGQLFPFGTGCNNYCLGIMITLELIIF